MPVDFWSAGVRASWLLALLQATGGALFLVLFGSRLGPSRARVRTLVRAAIALSAVTLGVFYLLEAARMAGAWGGMFDAELRALVWDGNRSAALARVGGLVLLAWGLASPRPAPLVTAAAALVLASSFALTGHTAETSAGPRALIVMHVLIAGFWAGSLAPLVLVTRHDDGATAAEIAARFTQIATFTVPLIAVAGVWLGYALGVRVQTLERPYGILLLVKLGAFGLLMLLAALNKWRLGPRLASDPRARRAFATSVVVEGVLIIGVVVATATLTTYFSPEL